MCMALEKFRFFFNFLLLDQFVRMFVFVCFVADYLLQFSIRVNLKYTFDMGFHGWMIKMSSFYIECLKRCLPLFPVTWYRMINIWQLTAQNSLLVKQRRHDGINNGYYLKSDW